MWGCLFPGPHFHPCGTLSGCLRCQPSPKRGLQPKQQSVCSSNAPGTLTSQLYSSCFSISFRPPCLPIPQKGCKGKHVTVRVVNSQAVRGEPRLGSGQEPVFLVYSPPLPPNPKPAFRGLSTHPTPPSAPLFTAFHLLPTLTDGTSQGLLFPRKWCCLGPNGGFLEA